MPNYDEKTGISYGVISPHAINPDALNDLYNEGTDPHYENAKEEFLQDLKEFCTSHYIPYDNVVDNMENEFNDSIDMSCGDGQCDYSDKDYILHISGDNFGIFVIKSPYYTYCRKCSPCAPGAGDLNTPLNIDDIEILDNYDRAYCLDKSYFDDEYQKIPYRVFRVDNDEEVI